MTGGNGTSLLICKTVRLAKGSRGCQAQRPAWAEPQPGVSAPSGDMSHDLSLVTSPCPSCGQFWAGDFGDGAVEKENCSQRDRAPLPHVHFTAQETEAWADGGERI